MELLRENDRKFCDSEDIASSYKGWIIWFLRKGGWFSETDIYPANLFEISCTRPLAKNIHASEPEKKKEILTRRKKISYIYMPREENIIVHEIVKKNRACNKSPIHTLSKVKLATAYNDNINWQLAQKLRYERTSILWKMFAQTCWLCNNISSVSWPWRTYSSITGEEISWDSISRHFLSWHFITLGRHTIPCEVHWKWCFGQTL